METENFAPPPPTTDGVEAVPVARRFSVPADYYSTPPGDRTPLFAPWATTGCGSVALALLAVAFTGGYVASHGGTTSLMTWVFSQTQSEIVPMYRKDVTPAQKAALDGEMKSLQVNVTAKRIPLERLQVILRDMRDAMVDNVVTPEETSRLTVDIHAANATAGATTPR